MKTTFHLAEIFNVVYFNVYLNIMSERHTRNLRIYSHLKKCQTENLLFCNGSFHGQQEPRICNLLKKHVLASLWKFFHVIFTRIALSLST